MEECHRETMKALEIDPQNADLHAILARLYAETGRTEEAMREYDRFSRNGKSTRTVGPPGGAVREPRRMDKKTSRGTRSRRPR